MKHGFSMLDYSALAAVDAVIREGSFDRAAKALGITPSAISQRVRGLENRLGAVLIARGQHCVATEVGRALCAHVAKVQLLESDLAPAFDTAVCGLRAPLTLKIAVNADSLATWFPSAIATFTRTTGILLDLVLEDEGHAADRLRSGEVVAAVTADPEPVQGCETIGLGALRYAVCASPDFMARFFLAGVNALTLGSAPCLRYDRRDLLQARWMKEAHRVALDAPIHWVPSTQAFLDLAILGVGWGVQPVQLVRRAIEAGLLVELPPVIPFEVNLYWTIVRLPAHPLRSLTQAVREAAKTGLGGDRR